MNTSYEQLIEIIPGTLVIYTLQGSKKKTWNMRIKFPHQPYIRKSLRTTDIHDAIQLARNAYFDQRGRVALNLPIGTFPFNRVLELYRASRDKDWSSFDRIADNYVKVFFQDNEDITKLRNSDIKDYWQWRLDYWTNHSSTVWSETVNQTVTNFAVNPKLSTLERDLYVIRRVFRFALDNSYIKVMPEVTLPSAFDKQSHETSRGSFTPSEYRYLLQCLRKEVSEPLSPDATAGQKRAYAPMMRRRRRLQTFILLLSNSGLRPSEAVKLRYQDFKIYTSEYGPDTGTEYTTIEILPEVSKVGKRRKVFCRDGRRSFDRIQYWRHLHADPRCVDEKDLVFPSNRDLKRPVDIKPTMKNFLNKYDLRIADDGRWRSAYSLRKVYASNRIQQGVGIHSLAINMGTSIAQLEKAYILHATDDVREELTANRRLELGKADTGSWANTDED
tara:strand:- start:1478 stop:2812 length:1335 start_codon:yes stop_codon:yes gene_type:complete